MADLLVQKTLVLQLVRDEAPNRHGGELLEGNKAFAQSYPRCIRTYVYACVPMPWCNLTHGSPNAAVSFSGVELPMKSRMKRISTPRG